MLICCPNTDSGFTVSNFADVANIIIAGFSLFLAYYIFVYQRQKDKGDKVEAISLQEQNIRLQWFKELIIQPHLEDINKFYSVLHSKEKIFSTLTLNEDLKITTVDSIKEERAKLRKVFDDLLRGVNPELHLEVKTNLDNLIDQITDIIFNKPFDLSNKSVFEKEIGSLITYSRNDLIKKIYSYKGN